MPTVATRGSILTHTLMICVAAAAADAQCVRDQLTGAAGVDPPLFGTGVAIDGDTLAVGAMLDTGSEWASGAVHLFEWDGVAWLPSSIVLAPDGDLTDMFGVSVALDADRLLVGAWWDEETGVRSGSAYLFERTGNSGASSWVFRAKLLPSDPLAEATFGRTVALSGDRAVVGAPLHHGAGSAAGAVYVFEPDRVGVWTQSEKILPEAITAGDRFGLALDLNGSTLAVGSPWASNERGRVDLFALSPTGAVQLESLLPGAIDAGDQFGFDVALNDARLLVGAYLDDELVTDGGSAWLYETDGAVWTLLQGPILALDLNNEDAQFGVSVALDPDHALIGARFATVAGTSAVRSGAAMVLSNSSSGLAPRAILVASTPQSEAEFSWQLAIDEDRAVVGSPYQAGSSEDEGAAYAIELTSTACGWPVGDLNHDGVIDGADLTHLLGAWGLCGDFAICAADLNGDFIVDGADLTILLGNWT